jgi:sugar/nucleoside kinase (ribokinase family)
MLFSKQPKQKQVICIGSTSLDIFFPTDEGVIIDTPDDVLSQKKIAFELGGKVLADEIHTAVGGVAANVAQGLALQGIVASAYTCVGRDENARFCLNELHKNGVETDLVQQLPGSKTDVSAIIVLLPGGERTIIHNRDSNKRLVVTKEALDADWIFVSSLNGAWQKNIETIFEAQQTRNFKLAVNPGQHNLHEDAALIVRLLRHTEVLILNKDEALELVLHMQPETPKEQLLQETFLLEFLLGLGVKQVAITDGARGAWCATKEERWFLGVVPSTKVVDVTGAGDAFGSGFFGALLKGERLDVALRQGVANSQSVVQFYGCNAGLLTKEQFAQAILHLVPEKL